MSVLSIRITLIICHIFITLLWAITSRGRNTANFFGLFRQTKSIPIVLFECFGFAQVLLLPYLAFSMKTESMPTVKLIGLLLALFGTLLASWAKIVMGRNWGRPAQHDKTIQSRLVTGGPFAYSRNPIYVGLLLLFLGQQAALQSYGIFLIFLFAYAVRHAVSREEQLLTKFFGQSYRTYIHKVPRFF